MGLETEQFWQKYEEGFNLSFQNIDNRLKKRFGLEENSSAKKKPNKIEYVKQKRKARLLKRKSWGSLSKLVSKFSIKKNSRSTKNPNLRFMQVKVDLNRRLLHQYYLKLMTEKKIAEFDGFNLDLVLVLESGNWTDLGVLNEGVFKSALEKSWRKWIDKNYSEFLVGGVSEAIDEGETEEQSESMIEQTDLESLESESGSGQILRVTKESTPSGKILNFKVEVNIQKLSESDFDKTKEFRFNIYTSLANSETGKLIAFEDISKESATFSYQDPKSLASSTASSVFNLPLGNFHNIKRKLLRIKASHSELIVQFPHDLSYLLKLKNLLEDQGIPLGLQATIENFSKQTSSLKVSYNGDSEKLFNLMNTALSKETYANEAVQVSKGSRSDELLLTLDSSGIISEGQEKI